MASSDVLTKVLKLADQTTGRDRLCRLVQYGSKMVSWAMEVESLSPDIVKKIKNLESSISTARKLFRLGKSIDQFRGALQTIHLSDVMLRVLVTLKKINSGLYLLLDHLLWASRMNLVTVETPYWNKLANQFWLLSIVLGLLRDFYDFFTLLRAERRRLQQYSGTSKPSETQALANVIKNNPPLMVDIVKNSTDFWIPASRVDYVYLPAGLVGLCGVVSSIAGLMSVYDQQLKLKFS